MENTRTRLHAFSERTANSVPLASLFREFASETTAHGLKNVASPARNVFIRCIWLLAVLAACAYLFFNVVTVLLDFYSYPFKTESSVTPLRRMAFPSVTICSLSAVHTGKLPYPEETKNILRSGSPLWNVQEDLNSLYQKEPYGEILNTNYYELLATSAPGIGDVMKRCLWNNENINCIDVFSVVYTATGICYAFNINTTHPLYAFRSGMKGGLSLVMNVNQSTYTVSDTNGAGYKIHLTHHTDFVDTLSGGLFVGPGYAYSIGFHSNKDQYLPYPYKAMKTDYCLERLPSIYEVEDKTYSRKACIIGSASHQASRQCGCNESTCTLYQYLTCYSEAFEEYYENGTFHDERGCKYPCISYTYPTSLSFAFFPTEDAVPSVMKLDPHVEEGQVRSSYLFVNLYYENFISRTSKHVPQWDSFSVMGTIGGNMGLFIGASLLSGLELIQLGVDILAYVIAWWCCRLPIRVDTNKGDDRQT